MAKEVDRRLAKDAKINLGVFDSRWKMFEVLRLHAEMYPESPKRWQMWMLVAVGAALFFGGFIASWGVSR